MKIIKLLRFKGKKIKFFLKCIDFWESLCYNKFVFYRYSVLYGENIMKYNNIGHYIESTRKE